MPSPSGTAPSAVRRLRARSALAAADLQLARSTSVDLPLSVSVAERPAGRFGLRLRERFGVLAETIEGFAATRN